MGYSYVQQLRMHLINLDPKKLNTKDLWYYSSYKHIKLCYGFVRMFTLEGAMNERGRRAVSGVLVPIGRILRWSQEPSSDTHTTYDPLPLSVSEICECDGLSLQ